MKSEKDNFETENCFSQIILFYEGDEEQIMKKEVDNGTHGLSFGKNKRTKVCQ